MKRAEQARGCTSIRSTKGRERRTHRSNRAADDAIVLPALDAPARAALGGPLDDVWVALGLGLVEGVAGAREGPGDEREDRVLAREAREGEGAAEAEEEEGEAENGEGLLACGRARQEVSRCGVGRTRRRRRRGGTHPGRRTMRQGPASGLRGCAGLELVPWCWCSGRRAEEGSTG